MKRAAVRALFWLLAACVVFIASLFFREQALPRSWLKAITDRLSSDEVLIRCDGAAFDLRRGVTLRGIRAYSLDEEKAPKTVAGAAAVSVNPVTRTVKIDGAYYPRLPESYYLPIYTERNAPLELELPDLPTFRLVLTNPDILGLRPARVVSQVAVRRNSISFDDVHVAWPEDAEDRVAEDGFFKIDLASQRAHGEVRGVATQAHIRPLMLALDIPSAMPYFDAFTEVPNPVVSAGEFDVNLINNDFRMKLDLRPDMGKYNGVAMSRAEGRLDLDVKTRGTNLFVRFGVDLPVALDPKGRQLSGGLGLTMTNDVVRLDFNAVSKLNLPDILGIVDVVPPSTLDFIKCETAPEITADGHIGTSLADIGWNDLAGGARFWRGSVFGFQTRSLALDWIFSRDSLTLANIRVLGKNGGEVQGSALISMPGFVEEKMTFAARGEMRNGTLDELADIFDLDLEGRDGMVNSQFEISGNLVTNVAASLCGSGTTRITNGHLLQMNLFAGLTKLLAEHVPGVGYIVNQSQASADWKIERGVFTTSNLFIEGGLVSLKGAGSYDIAEDQLDFTFRVQFLKSESLLGTVIHPMTWPFTKLLLEFKASGSIYEPKWKYISVIDRIF